MTQIYLNNDIKEKYNIDWNSAREESLPNTTLQNIFLICDYFNIDISKYFEIVKNVSDEEVDIAINSKKTNKTLLNIFKILNPEKSQIFLFINCFNASSIVS